MKYFVAAMLALVVLVGSYAFTQRPIGPSGGYIPITAVDAVVVTSNGGGYQIQLPMDLSSGWNGTFEYQLVNWNLKYKPAGVTTSSFVPIPGGLFQAPAFGQTRAYYTKSVTWPAGTYDVELTVDQLEFGFPDGSSTMTWSVTIP